MPSADFRRVDENTLHRGRLLTITEGTFEAPDGRHFQREIVRHPGAVVVVPFDQVTGEVVLVRQYRSPVEQHLLEVPAGKRDVPGEEPALTASRELTEETGLRAREIKQLGRFYTAPGFSDELMWCFLAQGLEPVDIERHGVEEDFMTIERYPLADVDGLVTSGQVIDAKTIVSLRLAQLSLGR